MPQLDWPAAEVMAPFSALVISPAWKKLWRGHRRANGTDSVFFSVSGQFTGGQGNSCVVTSTGTYTVTGGDGAFANATGSGTITTQIDKCAGTGTYTGTISRPNSD